MKKQTVICALIAFAAVYSTSFANVIAWDLEKIIDFVLCGAITTVFLNAMWNFINEEKE